MSNACVRIRPKFVHDACVRTSLRKALCRPFLRVANARGATSPVVFAPHNDASMLRSAQLAERYAGVTEVTFLSSRRPCGTVLTARQKAGAHETR
jgi:hypothetical protein